MEYICFLLNIYKVKTKMSKIILREIPLFDQNISEKTLRRIKIRYDNIHFLPFHISV